MILMCEYCVLEVTTQRTHGFDSLCCPIKRHTGDLIESVTFQMSFVNNIAAGIDKNC